MPLCVAHASPVIPLIGWLMRQDLPTKSLRSLVMQADALLSIMRFIVSDSNVAHHVHGVVLEIVGLLIRLTFHADSCVV